MTLENTDKAIADLLNKLPELIESASAQLPDIAQQMLVYGAFEAWIVITIGVLFLIMALFCAVRSFFSIDPSSWVMGCIIFILMAIIPLSAGLLKKYQIEHAPKLYLLEEAVEYGKCD